MFIPTQGDGRFLGTTAGGRPATFDYFAQVARAADALGFHGALLPTGRGCDDAWVTAAGLAAVTTRLKFLVAVRPGLIGPTLAYRMAATFDRQSAGRVLVNVVTGGDTDELQGDGLFLSHEGRYEQTDEFLTVWRGLARGETIDYAGTHLTVRGARQFFTAVRLAAVSEAKAAPDLAAPKPGEAVSFARQVVPALGVAGCNAGTCHGTPCGKNEFKLALRGFDPAADHNQSVHDSAGRRVNVPDPDQSLFLLKGRGKVPHEGGIRLKPGDPADTILREWVRQGATADPADLPAHTKLEVRPTNTVIQAPARTQRVTTTAHFADKSAADVTRLTVVRSSDEAVAKVDAAGLVSFARTGEVAIQTKYLNEIVSVRLPTAPKP